jgi:hypothetical protein
LLQRRRCRPGREEAAALQPPQQQRSSEAKEWSGDSGPTAAAAQRRGRRGRRETQCSGVFVTVAINPPHCQFFFVAAAAARARDRFSARNPVWRPQEKPRAKLGFFAQNGTGPSDRRRCAIKKRTITHQLYHQ